MVIRFMLGSILSSSFAHFEDVFWAVRDGIRRGLAIGFPGGARQLSSKTKVQPERLRDSTIWARTFFASLLPRGSVRTLSCQLRRRRVVSMSAKEGSFF